MADKKTFALADLPKLEGKVAVVTGANSGIGYHTALELGGKGCHVVLACRDQKKCQGALDDMLKKYPKASFEAMSLDLSSLESVKKFSDELHQKQKSLDILVNNAGIMAIPFAKSKDGFELQFATNHLGHFALTGYLFDLLKSSPNSRIVNVSSMLHKSGKLDFENLNGEKSYSAWGNYANSKLANLFFTSQLVKKINEAGIENVHVASAHPGYSATNLQSKGPEMSGSWFGGMMMSVSNYFFAMSADKGALPSLMAATSPLVRPGDFCGPNGFNNMWGDNAIVHLPDACANNEKAAETLWSASEKMTGVNFTDILSQKSKL